MEQRSDSQNVSRRVPKPEQDFSQQPQESFQQQSMHPVNQPFQQAKADPTKTVLLVFKVIKIFRWTENFGRKISDGQS